MRPADIPEVYRLLTQHFRRHREAPVATLATKRTNAPYRVLVATILSARTRDQTTTAVIQHLFARAPDLPSLAKLSLQEIEESIRPVGFSRAKARALKALPEVLLRDHGGHIPESVDELVRLPGVGRKTANLVIAEAFGQPAICVDVHVHRIVNRFGLVRTHTPLQTENALRRLLPVACWKRWNPLLVALGQTICRPRNPRCPICPVNRWCGRVGVPAAPTQAAPPARPLSKVASHMRCSNE